MVKGARAILSRSKPITAAFSGCWGVLAKGNDKLAHSKQIISMCTRHNYNIVAVTPTLSQMEHATSFSHTLYTFYVSPVQAFFLQVQWTIA